MSPWVDVQRPECGEFSRYFSLLDDAERYVKHMREVRGYLAEIRRGAATIPENITPKEGRRWVRTQEIRRIARKGDE
ncbi:MAG: hypothetical protein WC294_08345 [Methanoregula sp.]|jgi:hypothetical protein